MVSRYILMIIKRISLFLYIFCLLITTIANIYSVDTITIFSPNYFEEESNEDEVIHFLDNELLMFEYCTDTPVEKDNVKLTCSDTKLNVNLSPVKSGPTENCHFYNYDLNELQCDNIEFELTYSTDNIVKGIKRDFQKQKESKVIEHILKENKESLSPLQLSYYLSTIVNLDEVESSEIEETYELLKNKRNNVNKCWEQNVCDIDITSEILMLLKVFGSYDSNSRLLKDGKNYLEKNLITNDNTLKDFLIDLDDPILDTNSSEISCIVQIDDLEDEDYDFNEDDKSLEDSLASTITFTCNETIDEVGFYVFDLEGDVEISKEYTNITTFTQTIDDFSCFGVSGKCKLESSLNTLLAYSSSIEGYSLVSSYLDNNLVESSSDSYLNTNDRIRDSGKYLFYKSDDSVLDFLKFKQNNDGSWGTEKNSEKVEKTIWATLGIKNIEGESEYVDDAKKWIYFNEPTVGWGDVKKNALAYAAIREQIKPYIKINPINIVKGSVNLTLANPTIFNLNDITVSFDSGLDEYISYTKNLGELSGNSNKNFTLVISPDLVGEKSGNMKIEGTESSGVTKTYINMPIKIIGTFNINYIAKNYTVTQDNYDVYLNFEVVGNSQANCSYTNPYTESIEKIILSKATSSIKLENSFLDDRDVNFNISCMSGGTEKLIPVNYKTNVIKKTFDTDIKEIVLTKYVDVDFDIISNSNVSEKITVELKGAYDGILLPTEEEFTLNPLQEKELNFIMGDTTFLEYLEGDQLNSQIILTGERGYQKIINIVREPTPGINDGDETSGGGLGLMGWISIVVLIVVIIFGGLVYYRYNQLKKLEKDAQEQVNDESDEEIYLE